MPLFFVLMPGSWFQDLQATWHALHQPVVTPLPAFGTPDTGIGDPGEGGQGGAGQGGGGGLGGQGGGLMAPGY